MERHVGRYVGMLHNQITRMRDDHGEHNLTHVQGRILHYVLIKGREDGVLQKDIEQDFNLRRPSATVLLQKLESAGMIERRSIESDQRIKKIFMTEKGIAHQKMIVKEIERTEAILRKGISEEQMDLFFNCVEVMIHNCLQVNQEKEENHA